MLAMHFMYAYAVVYKYMRIRMRMRISVCLYAYAYEICGIMRKYAICNMHMRMLYVFYDTPKAMLYVYVICI